MEQIRWVSLKTNCFNMYVVVITFSASFYGDIFCLIGDKVNSIVWIAENALLV